MASLRREFRVDAHPDAVWDTVRDFGAVHERLANGFVTACAMEEDGAVRRIRFANGIEARERLVTCDDPQRRLVYCVKGGRATHYNASVEVVADGAGSRFVWVVDLSPDALAPAVGGMMDAGVQAMQATLQRLAAE